MGANVLLPLMITVLICDPILRPLDENRSDIRRNISQPVPTTEAQIMSGDYICRGRESALDRFLRNRLLNMNRNGLENPVQSSVTDKENFTSNSVGSQQSDIIRNSTSSRTSTIMSSRSHLANSRSGKAQLNYSPLCNNNLVLSCFGQAIMNHTPLSNNSPNISCLSNRTIPPSSVKSYIPQKKMSKAHSESNISTFSIESKRRYRGPSISTILRNKEKTKENIDPASQNVSLRQNSNTIDKRLPSHVAANLINNFDDAYDGTHVEELFDEEAEPVDLPGINLWDGYVNIGPPTSTCVQLPPEKQPTEPLRSLLYGSERTIHFKLNHHLYNSLFVMCSSGGKIDHKINKGGAPYCFKVKGQNLHLLGSMLPADGESPKFCQVYIYDTENELENRMNLIGGSRDEIDESIVEALMDMLNQHNELVRQFHTARERFKYNEQDEFRLFLLSSQSASGRLNIIGPTDEVGGLILQYPLLFPHAEEGFHTKIPLIKTKFSKSADLNPDDNDFEKKHREYISMKEYYCYKLMIRHSEGLTLHLSGHLWQQYVVDSFCAIEQYLLDWVTTHQTTIRSDLYTSIRDALRKGDHNPNYIGKAVVLPASFTGSQRYMSQNFKDALALCRAIGHPSLFLTMTCNKKCPEITEMMKSLLGVYVCDAPDIVSRVFKLKLDQLMHLIKMENYFGKCIGVMHVIKFQKWGLPHMHMLIWLHPDARPKIVAQIDALVSAEIPDKDTDPVGYAAVSNYMIHGPCGVDNTYSPCMVKGRCSMVTRILMIVVFPFIIDATLAEVDSKRTKLEAWFEANKEFPTARDFTYVEFSTHFTWLPRECKWRPRQRGDVVGRLTEVHATGGDLLYLRMLLMRRKGSTSFDELRKVEGHVFESFKEACAAMGLLQNDSQWHEAMVENSHSSLVKQLREMFFNILAYCSISDPLFLWNAQWKCMSDDIILLKCKESRNRNLHLPDCDIQNFALAEIEKLLNDIGKSLKDFPTMSYPPELFLYNSGNGLIAEEIGKK
ncbi:uncharacterized protein LOC141690736 [Apium graveolens]|uniref:uncharacterized protein LOC141690736 n=1 Tax=Apium graveolens TaxID=4045 RepID=UPI003D79451F